MFVVGTVILGVAALAFLSFSGYVAPFTGRFYSLWDTGYAKKYIPIIASVSEHQPTAWPSFFFDLHMLIPLLPAGIFLCFKHLQDEVQLVVLSIYLSSTYLLSFTPLPRPTLLELWFD